MESEFFGLPLIGVMKERSDLRDVNVCWGLCRFIRGSLCTFDNDGVSVKEEPNVGGEKFHFGAATSLNYNTIPSPNHSLDVYSTCEHYQLPWEIRMFVSINEPKT